METIENFDFNELKISREEIKEYDIHIGKPYPSYEQALLRSEGNLVLSIREVSQRLELMEGCTI